MNQIVHMFYGTGPSHKMVQGRRFGKLLHDNIPAMLHILER